MAKLSFNYDGQSYVSDVFSGGKVVQLTFPIERTKVLYLETRLALPVDFLGMSLTAVFWKSRWWSTFLWAAADRSTV